LKCNIHVNIISGWIKLGVWFICLDLRNEFICFVCGLKYPSEKKRTGICIIARSAWCKVSVIFFRMDTSSSNKTNKSIPYHLITSKHKYYVIKLYIFHDLFMSYTFCDVWVYYDVVVLCQRSMDSKIHPIFQPIVKRVTWKIKWLSGNVSHGVCHCYMEAT
jgi:hypothetical protein